MSAKQQGQKQVAGNKQNANNKQGAKQGGRQRRRSHTSQQQKEVVPSVTREDLAKLKVAELRAKAEEFGLDAAGLK
jgi:transcription termination factor Rho